MSEPQGEWLATPEVQAGADSEWTSEPLPTGAHSRREPPYRGLLAAVVGIVAFAGFATLAFFLVLRSAHRNVYGPSQVTPGSSGPTTHIATKSAPEEPSKPKAPNEVATHWVSAPAVGLPRVDLTLASGPLPSTVQVGHAVTMDLQATCLTTGDEDPSARDGRTRGGISVSADGDATLSSPTPEAEHFPVGSPITAYVKGSDWTSHRHARNDLIENTASPWRKGRVLSLRVVVTPTKPGQVTLFVRSTATLRKRPVSSTEGSSDLDQQGLPVHTFHMTITE